MMVAILCPLFLLISFAAGRRVPIWRKAWFRHLVNDGSLPAGALTALYTQHRDAFPAEYHGAFRPRAPSPDVPPARPVREQVLSTGHGARQMGGAAFPTPPAHTPCSESLCPSRPGVLSRLGSWICVCVWRPLLIAWRWFARLFR